MMQPGQNMDRQATSADTSGQTAQQLAGEQSASDGPPVAGSARLIAIVEDDTMLATTFKQVLEEERGWDTMVVGDGQEALRVLPEAHPDMILLDMTLPGLDGISLYRMLRARRETATTPILIVTAHHAWELQRSGLEPHQLLRKPFDIDDLLTAIETLMDSA
jgi:DNA-binding response OmpR family regulator